MLAPIWEVFCGSGVIGIGDNVRLSAIAVYAALALSHTYGIYKCHAPVDGIVIARGSKAVFAGDYY